MNFPPEILLAIASELSGEDLGSFRLINRECASAGIASIARNGVSLLNTSRCLGEFKDILQCQIIADTVRKLTFFHGIWPVCSRLEWETLLCSGNDTSTMGEQRGKAFSNYLDLISEEENRRYGEDVERLFRILTLLPKVTSLTISHMGELAWKPSYNLKYRKLQRRVWISPVLVDSVELSLQMLLLALGNSFPNITSLAIQGRFSPSEVHINSSTLYFTSIGTLHMSYLQVRDSKATKDFLLAFPNLVDLSITFDGWGSSPPQFVKELTWLHLKRLYLGNIWASEQELYTAFGNHRYTLERFTLTDGLLTQGSWRSLFTRIRALNSPALILVDGELYGRRRSDSIVIDQSAADKFQRFLKDNKAPWPFRTFN